MKLKFYRDKIVSIVKGKELVGVYIKYSHTKHNSKKSDMFQDGFYHDLLLAEMSPTKANEIIKLWNSK